MAIRAIRHSTRRTIGRLTAAIALAMLTAVPAAAQRTVDADYTALIREYTTEPFFLTPYVDYLPGSTAVPTPLDVLGHIVGAPDVLTYPEQIYDYMRRVAEASPRVSVFSIGTTEEGREMIVVVASSEETMARLDEYKDMTARLTDPRTTSEEEAAELIGMAKPIYYATGAIHSTETGSPEMLMELVYRLAVDESEFVQAIRDNLIFMATPVVEVDGRAKVVDLHMAPRIDPDANVRGSPLYWGAYVAHDNNRDGIGLSLKLTQNVLDAWLDYHPTVLHDLHESASYLYTSTGRGPYNAWIDPIVVEEWNRLAHKEVQDMTAFGVPGIYTHNYYDGWAPNYMFWIANMRNAIGRFYETQGSGNASYRVLNTNVDREWHRMNPPLPSVMWGIRNNVNLQQSALFIALHEVATNREEYMRNYWRKGQRSVAKPTLEGPAAYAFPASDPRLGQQARLLSLMQRHGVEVHRTDAAVTAGGRSFPAGSYVIRMDQPYSRAADMLLDIQYYNPNDPSPYDDVGWTLGPMFNTETVRVTDSAILGAPMTLVSDPVRAPGGIANAEEASAFLINYNADNNLTAFRFQNRSLRINAAEQGFSSGGQDFRAGTFIVPVSGNPRNLAALLDEAGQEFGFTAIGVSTVPEVSTHPVGAPRIALLHTWQSTQSEGWVRIGLDEYGIPYDYISVHEVRDNARLRNDYDVILFGPSSGNAFSILEGVTGDDPVPWKATELTPNIGRQASSDDIRGGIEFEGVIHLRDFIRQGGLFLTITSSASLPTHFGLAADVSIQDREELWAPGGVFSATLQDASSPIAYGYDEELGVFFDNGPIFAVGGGGGGGRGGRGGGGGGAGAGDDDPGSTTARRSSRGGIDDEATVPGRAINAGQASINAMAGQTGGGGGRGGSGGGDPEDGPRVIFQFNPDQRSLLISGGLTNGDELAGAPALVDAQLGDGHVVLFSFNPFWRGETLGAYGLVFNAILHHEHLNVGRAVANN